MIKFATGLLFLLYSSNLSYSAESNSDEIYHILPIETDDEVCPIVDESDEIYHILPIETDDEVCPIVDESDEIYHILPIETDDEVCPIVDESDEIYHILPIETDDEVCPIVDETEEIVDIDDPIVAEPEEITDSDELCPIVDDPQEIVDSDEIYHILPIFDEPQECIEDGVTAPQILCDEVSHADREIEIRVAGLIPYQEIKIEASWVDSDHVQWCSWAEFKADAKGVVNLSRQAPVQGSYAGVDAMGLFWSMEMGHVVILENLRSVYLDDECDHAFIIHLTVSDENGEIAEKGLCRLISNPETEVIELRENGLVGDLFIPPSEEALPVVIVLSGSNGGIPSGLASIFASNGIAAFALAYSGIDDLPPEVEFVPLEYFERAFEWIQHHPRLNGKIYLHGTSRGAELALLLGSMFPESIDRIVAAAPSSVVLSKDSWTYNGKSVLPAAPFFIDFNYDYHSDFSTRDQARSIRIHRERGFFLENERFQAASIRVEKINCPILLISGGDDQLGPASFYAKLILDRLDKHRSQIKRIHLDYPNAGHYISVPYYPRSNVHCDNGWWQTVGGTPLADELASRDSWLKTLQFLGE